MRAKSRIIVEILALTILMLTSCDLRSGIARDEEAKLRGNPTPTAAPTPTPIPIDPSDIVQVDTLQSGESLVFNQRQLNKSVDCSKFNDVNVNIRSAAATITGACNQIIINGDDNQITAEATMKFVINGDGNNIGYSKFPNGQRPLITDNGSGNVVEKISADASVTTMSDTKKDK